MSAQLPAIIIALALVAGVVLLALFAIPRRDASGRRRMLRRSAAGLTAPIDEIFHPTGHQAAEIREVEVSLPAPAPLPAPRAG